MNAQRTQAATLMAQDTVVEMSLAQLAQDHLPHGMTYAIILMEPLHQPQPMHSHLTLVAPRLADLTLIFLELALHQMKEMQLLQLLF